MRKEMEEELDDKVPMELKKTPEKTKRLRVTLTPVKLKNVSSPNKTVERTKCVLRRTRRAVHSADPSATTTALPSTDPSRVSRC
ncbi:uncharacterized protein LOC121694894 isoform X2 [Alosa sapidissima]|uniref:uncharacterized protein LOC121694894 isoform X2 n=1 Tax=Alosa sapidissima TaxID=34773 RepID=UPI001C08496A|nr:uncharacterized protein LOC121694894 isoform X2 [Alosa sapidissima]